MKAWYAASIMAFVASMFSCVLMLGRVVHDPCMPAVQSYLWNTAASHRVEIFGSSSVIAGDLVLQRGAAAPSALIVLRLSTAPSHLTWACRMTDLLSESESSGASYQHKAIASVVHSWSQDCRWQRLSKLNAFFSSM